MVRLRSSTGGGDAKLLDTSSEFISLDSPRKKRQLTDTGGKKAKSGTGFGGRGSNTEDYSDEENFDRHMLRSTRNISRTGQGCFSDAENSGRPLRSLRKRTANGLNSSDSSFDKSPKTQIENVGKRFTRSTKLQANAKTNGRIPEDKEEAEKTVEEQVDTDVPVSRGLRTRSADKACEPAHEENVEVRRSGRIRRSRYSTTNQSVLFDKLITNTAEAVLAKMDDMKKMRRRRMRELDDLNDTETFNDTEEENLDMYSRVKRRRKSATVDEETTDNQDESGESSEEGEDQDEDEDEEDEDEDEEDEDEDEEDEDEDGEVDNQKRYDFRQRKEVVRYQAPLEEPRHQRKPKIFYSGPSSPVRRRYRFSSAGPRSPYCKRRKTRRHAIHSSDSTSSSSSSDEEHFERRRNRSRSKSISRCLPLNMRKEDLKGIHKDRIKIGASLADVDPMQIDSSVRFDSIGGLANHIASLKEMVVFPLLYPEIFERFKIQPPRGCLFYGPPGTGKTLVARALANECSQGDKKVAFFMRKGADCLSKWVGESERQLRLLFDQAHQMRPSIIFFDEIDGLAPVRSSRQDQIHSSIVSTLLALMDGLDCRGEIVVIGATNRLDSIDPALRRPGRFDREFLFSLPDKDARKEILKIHTRDWSPKLSDVFVQELAEKCVGYCGADIKSVCAEAAICALRRRYPQIYTTSDKLQLDISSITIMAKDFVTAMQKIVPASQRAVVSPGQALSPIIKPLLQNTLDRILGALQRVFPHAELGMKKLAQPDDVNQLFQSDLMYSDDEGPSVFENGLSPKQPNLKQKETHVPFLQFSRSAHRQPTSYRPRLLISGDPNQGQGSHLAPAVLHTLEKFTVYTLDLAVLFGVSATSPEETCAQMFREAKRTAPSILYIPHIHMWWETVGCTLKATFMTLLRNIPSFTPILMLATSESPLSDLPEEVQDLFVDDYGEVFHVQPPSTVERRAFFEDLILNQAAKPPSSRRKAVLQALEVLPVAPPPAPRPLTAEEIKRLESEEEGTLRELRLFLRDVTHRLAIDKRFRAFTKPVDLEEVPDYVMVIAQPMDLSTVISKIDLHKYNTVKDYLKDIDLMCSNALEYNPDKNPADRQIRHRACTLRDVAYAIIKDELDEDFEKVCEEILESRKKRGGSSSMYAPSYYQVQPKKNSTGEGKKTEFELYGGKASASHMLCSTPSGAQSKRRRSRRKSKWSSGTIAKKKKTPSTIKNESLISIEDADDSDCAPDNHNSSMDQSELELHGDSSLDAEGESAVHERLCNGTEKSRDEDHETEIMDDCQTLNNPVSSDLKKQTEASNGETPNSQVSINGHRADIQDLGVLRMTRARHSLVEQQHLINVEKAMQILSEPVPPFHVDHQQLKNLLDRVTQKSHGYNVCQLEKLYALLGQCIYRHRKHYDKTQLIEELREEIENFKL